MEKHYVIFMSPGTLVSETTKEEIDSWDVFVAMEMARHIKERHGATPYGFYFITKERKDWEFESKIIRESKMYYLGGVVKTLAEVEAENNPDNKILISNMKGNGYDRVIVNTNSWKITLPVKKDDVVLPFVQ